MIILSVPSVQARLSINTKPKIVISYWLRLPHHIEPLKLLGRRPVKQSAMQMRLNLVCLMSLLSSLSKALQP